MCCVCIFLSVCVSALHPPPQYVMIVMSLTRAASVAPNSIQFYSISTHWRIKSLWFLEIIYWQSFAEVQQVYTKKTISFSQGPTFLPQPDNYVVGAVRWKNNASKASWVDDGWLPWRVETGYVETNHSPFTTRFDVSTSRLRGVRDSTRWAPDPVINGFI